MSAGRIKQAREALIAIGALTYHASRGGGPSRWVLPDPKEVERRGIVEYILQEPHAPERLFETPPVDHEFKKKATYIANKWMSETTPTPLVSGGVVGAIKIVERALAAGWSEGDVEVALGLVPTLTIAALEFALRRDRPAPNPGQTPGQQQRPVCQACNGAGWVAGEPDANGRMKQVVKCPACSSEY